MSNKANDMKTLTIILITAMSLVTPVFAGSLDTTKTNVENVEVSERNKKLKRLRKFKKSVNKNTDLKDYSFHQKVYTIEADLETVWETYTNVKPNEAWSGPLNTFKQSYSNQEDTLYEAGDSLLPSIELGMVYELNLRIAKILDVGVAFQITELDSANHTIEFTYGKDNKSQGRQRR